MLLDDVGYENLDMGNDERLEKGGFLGNRFDGVIGNRGYSGKWRGD
ncbi:hypothetical protein [Staphylococcus aureus]|nr:hypothetical protein [Staphylococcus aureus]